MSYSEQWNIQNLDTNALRKITEIAEAQGTNAHDFFNNLIKNSSASPSEAIKEINEALKDVPLQKKNINEPIQKNDISQNLSDELNAYSESVKKELVKSPSHSQKSILNSIPEKQKILAKKNVLETVTTVAKKTNTAKNARSNTRTPRRSIEKNSQTSNLFETLTKKIGIDNTVISQLASSDITDTIMRERQLRDFMRIQMTEMRDIMGTMFEKKIDDKLQQFSHIIDATYNNQVQNNNFGSDIDFNEILKTDDFNFKLAILADNLQSKIQDAVSHEFSHSINVLHNSTKEQSDNVVDNITKLYDLICDNISHHIEKSIQDLSTQIIQQSSLDNPSSQFFQEHTDALSARIEHIENLCSGLDSKITQMHLDHIQHSQNIVSSVDNHQAPNMDIVKSEFINITQSLKDYMKEIIDNNNTNQEKNSNNIVNTLKSMSDRLSALEEMVSDTDTPATTRYLDDDSHRMPASYHAYDLSNHDNPVHTSSNILESEWDDNDGQTNSEEGTEDNIRSFDRKSFTKEPFLKNHNKNKNTKEESGNSMVKNLFKKLI